MVYLENLMNDGELDQDYDDELPFDLNIDEEEDLMNYDDPYNVLDDIIEHDQTVYFDDTADYIVENIDLANEVDENEMYESDDGESDTNSKASKHDEF